MKKLVLIEDNPWSFKQILSDLKAEDVGIETILYYSEASNVDVKTKEKLQDLDQKLKIQSETIEESNFKSIVDKYYDRDDIFILVDFVLGEYNKSFGKRINIIYANQKKEKGKGKLWFYTAAGREYRSMLVNNFVPEQLVDVTRVENGQYFFDIETIREIATNG